MTQPNEMPAADPGNPFLAPGPVGFTSSVIEFEGKQLCMVTMRTSSGTLTGFLPNKQMIDGWIKVLEDGKSKMTDLVIAPANIQLPKMDGHGHS